MAQKLKWPIAVQGVETGNLPAMPIHVSWRRWKAKVSLEYQGDEAIFLFSEIEGPDPLDPREWLRADIARSAFLAVKTPDEALRFFSETGAFLREGEEGPDAAIRFIKSVTWSDFQRWQDLFRFVSQNQFLIIVEEDDDDGSLLETHIRGWRPPNDALPEDLKQLVLRVGTETKAYLSGAPALRTQADTFVADSQNRKPKLNLDILPFGTMQAMLASLYVALEIGMDFRKCAREHCQELFIADDKRGKQYCSQKCAHHASVTRDRDKKKADRDKKKAIKSKKRVRRAHG